MCLMARKQKRERNDNPSSPDFELENFSDSEHENIREESRGWGSYDGEEEEEDDDDEDDIFTDAYGDPPEVVALRAQTDKFFSVRNQLNKEIAYYLGWDKHFNTDLRSVAAQIRKNIAIPKLERHNDGRAYFDNAKKQWVRESRLFANLPAVEQDKLEREINKLIDRYRLPTAFHDWFLEWILYDMPPRWEPVFNFELLNDVFENPERIMRLGLTTGEKIFVRTAVKKQLGIGRGRPPKQHVATLKKVEDVLSKSRSPVRTFLSFHIATDIFFQKSRTTLWCDPEGIKEDCERNFTYVDVVKEAYHDKHSYEQFKQRVMRARKYMERLNKRKNKLLNNK
jgi:hypothetical protein